MGSMGPETVSKLSGGHSGGVFGLGGGTAPPVVQQSPQQPQQDQGGLMQMFLNQILGMNGPNKTSFQQAHRPPQAASSPRDTLIQSLMGGSHGW